MLVPDLQVSHCAQTSSGLGEEGETRQWRETPGPSPACGRKSWMGSWPRLGGRPIGVLVGRLHFHSHPLKSAMSDWSYVCGHACPVCSVGFVIVSEGFSQGPKPSLPIGVCGKLSHEAAHSTDRVGTHHSVWSSPLSAPSLASTVHPEWPRRAQPWVHPRRRWAFSLFQFLLSTPFPPLGPSAHANQKQTP